MDILSAQALAELSNDELLTRFIHKFPIVDPDTITATRSQLIDALVSLCKAA